ncbi:MAG: hypothetical protein KUA43_13840 [Hoeflea sp.]|nr:hypothetical protein [Hoeflea sp.]MBU4531240.1 hypothetical protein [Alphaproteobacteria bacterium]MBU4545697.1 hypothetical protein [Alphaproteobacteria bacterium]MBU4550666.1 hypothetical protein [Alphaproteobacteria bacterium]MBV1724517.1 hypothetical protein [Hoeflea sp.]MBV1783432.1 hypothetical protein [Hoeflea sp.]
MAAKKKPATADNLVTQARIAELCGCVPRTVREYLQRGIIPASTRGANGKLYERAAVSAVVCHFRESAAGRSIAAGPDGQEIDPIRANAELRVAQTHVAREQLRVVRAKGNLLEGQVIRRPSVEAAMRAVIAGTKASLVALPIEINSALGGLPTADQLVIEDLVERKLADMAREMPAAIARTIAAENGEDDEDGLDE